MATRVVGFHTRSKEEDGEGEGERDGAARAVLPRARGAPTATPVPARELQAWRALRHGNEESGCGAALVPSLLRGSVAQRGRWGALQGLGERARGDGGEGIGHANDR